MRRDAVILGAGLAGSSLAAVLGELGWDVVLLERRHFPQHKVCGEFLSPEAQTSLAAMGLHQAVAALSPSVMAWAKLVSPHGLTAQVALPGRAWGVSRFALDAALAAAAESNGVELRTEVTATAINPIQGGFEVALRSKAGLATIRARTVMAACGRYSLPGLPPRSQGQTHQAKSQSSAEVGLKCHYEGVTMPGQVELFFFPGGYGGVSPIEGQRVNVCMLVTPAAFAQAGKRVQSMVELAACWNPGLGQRLAGSQPVPETEVAVAPVDTYRRAAPWDGVACLGDTVVMIPPLCGDGMAMALRSAELCAPLAHDFLRGRLSWAGWAAAYQAAWHAEFDRPVRIGRSLQIMLARPVFSDLLIGLGRLVPPLATFLVRATRGAHLQPLFAPSGLLD